MSRKTVEVARRAIAAYNERDFEALRALNDRDVQLDWTASRGLEAGVYQGQEEVIRFFQDFLETFEEVEIEPERFIESGESVVVPNRAKMRGRDGIETVARSAFVFEFRGDRIARVRLCQATQEALADTKLAE